MSQVETASQVVGTGCGSRCGGRGEGIDGGGVRKTHSVRAQGKK